MAAIDPETEFLASKKQTENEWEIYKQNVRPLKRGRNVEVLNDALRSQTDNSLKRSLRETRRRLIQAIDEYKGEDLLRPWIDCIKWVQEYFPIPTGGECSGRANKLEKLEAAYQKFLVRSAKKKTITEDNAIDNNMPNHSFGTVLAAGATRRQPMENSDLFRKNVKLHRVANNKPFSIYKDENSVSRHQPENLKSTGSGWHTLGTFADRNKENTSAPTIWSSYKVPQKTVTRTLPTTSSSRIEVFIDEDCADSEQLVEIAKSPNPSILQLRKANSKNLKKETELLRENPLRNFPLNSLR